MIDLHLHLLPGIDDGAETADVSHLMIEGAARLGFATLVATPHLAGALTPAFVERTQGALESLRAAGAAAGVAIALGYEIMLSPDLAGRLERGEPSTLAGSRTVLVELPFGGWPAHAEHSLFALQSAGFTPLLAHPERYAVLQQDFDRAVAMAERGILLQVTLGSLVGLFGKAAQRTAERLMQANVVAVLASDAHSAGHRFRAIAEGLRRGAALVGPARLEQLVVDAPTAILADAPLPTPAPIRSLNQPHVWRRPFGRAAKKPPG